MTIVAWDGKKMAADKMATMGGSISRVTKVVKVNGHLVAGAGSACSVLEFVDWFMTGGDINEFPQTLRGANHPDEVKGFVVMVITPDNRILVFEDSPYPVTVEDEFFAIGSGADYAMATMHLGFDAERAVKVASELCNTCGCGVDVRTHESPDDITIEPEEEPLPTIEAAQ